MINKPHGIPTNGFWYQGQLKNYILQFMAIFQGLQVQIGKRGDENEKLIPVPIAYAHKDRVVAAILADNTQNKVLRLPTMSAYMRSLNIALDSMHGTGTERRMSYVPLGGLVPDDIKTIHQRMPLPYKLGMELNLYASNTNQHFQMLEQILPFFDPQLTIQTSDGLFDWTRLTSVKLTDVNIETNYPIGTDKRIVQSTINFEMNIWFDTPADVRRDFVEKVFLRIGAVNNTDLDNFDIIAELDAQGLEYSLVADANTLTVDQ